MSVRQVQVRGCLPTAAALVVIGAVLAAFLTASVAFLAVAIAAGLLAAGVRWARRLTGSTPSAETPARAADATIEGEVIGRTEGPDDPPKRLEGP